MKSRIDYIWAYYKWQILAVALALIVAADFIVQKVSQVDPDVSVGIVSSSPIGENTLERLSSSLSLQIEDSNGDGKRHVEISMYAYDGNASEAGDPSLFIAGAVQLANDLKEEISLYYITDCPEILLAERPELEDAGAFEEFCGVGGFPELEGFRVLSRR